MNITNIEDARKIAQNISEENRKQAVATKEAVQEWLKESLKEDNNDSVFSQLASLMALEDDQFELIAPTILEELERSYNDPNQIIILVQAFNAQGVKAEDVQQEYEEFCNYIDTEIGSAFSSAKKQFLKRLLGLTYNAVAGSEGIAKKVVNVSIEHCHLDAKNPTYAHTSDSGMDVYALEDITINPGETVLVPTGIKVALPIGYELQVRPKSGRALKTKLRIANAPGTIDAGYRDEIKIIVENVEAPIKSIVPKEDGTIDASCITYGSSFTIGKGEKFAQLVLAETPKVAWIETKEVDSIEGNRGGGFGSSGLK